MGLPKRKNGINCNIDGIYIEFYLLVYPIGINIVPIGCFLFIRPGSRCVYVVYAFVFLGMQLMLVSGPSSA